MTCCGHCQDAGELFGDRTARRELKRYRRKGPSRPTRLLIDSIRAHLPDEGTLLDIGGGVGAIQHELFGHGLASAIQVDASTAYLGASREEAARRGHAVRVEHLYGDFADLADGLPDADVVTLDRVVCCYPDMERLVDASAPKAKRVYGLVYPRERWTTRLIQIIWNVYLRLRRSAFRTYLHPVTAIEARVRSHGLEPVARDRMFFWEIVTYRANGAPGASHRPAAPHPS